MSKSFSFSAAWARNDRHRSALERFGNQIADELGYETEREAEPHTEGDRLRRERKVTRDPETGEVINERVGFESYPGSLDGTGADYRFNGQRTVVFNREFDSDSGLLHIDHVPEGSDGSLGSHTRTTLERTGEREWRITGSRRIR